MNYREARAYMEGKSGNIEPGLSRIRALLEELGHPEQGLKYIHIAGTNGKGSILSYISTVLTHAGYRVGRYISPSPYSYREKFQVNGEKISREVYTELAEEIEAAMKRLETRGGIYLSVFEIETVLCFLYFKRQQCDWVVLECGLGGKGDSTNVIPSPELAVFASISLDHMKYLGETLTEIAREKSGIIKAGTQVVTGNQAPEVLDVLKEVCALKGVPMVAADTDSVQIEKNSLTGQEFLYHNYRIEISLPGSCQVENAVTAFEALKLLHKKGVRLTDQQIREGMKQTVWNGRFTCIGTKPYFFVDGAHNPAAAQKLKESIETYFQGRRLIFINGIFADKDYREIINITAPLADKIYTVATPGNPRALAADLLAKAVAEVNPNVQSCAGLEEAVKRAYEDAGAEDVILAFGSLSFLRELTEITAQYRENNYVRSE